MARQKTPELTSRQREILTWVISFIRRRGMPPTLREIGDAFGIKTTSALGHMKALERKGHLRRGEHEARSLVIEHGRARVHECCEEVPILGHIAAGKPILAVESDLGTITVDATLTRGRPTYALRVEGESMVDAGILDGDYVVVRKQDTADDGDIIVALIEDEATLKRFHREGNGVRLDPANREMRPILVQTGEFRIQGKLVAVQRAL